MPCTFDLAMRAACFAIEAHKAQRRKYIDDAYIVHPMRVATLVATAADVTDSMLATAWLHDTVEDCGVRIVELEVKFGSLVADYVRVLSDDPHDKRNRAARKKACADKVAAAPGPVHTIKYCDLIDNMASIVEHDPKFAVTFLEEAEYLVQVARRGDQALRTKLEQMIGWYTSGSEGKVP